MTELKTRMFYKLVLLFMCIVIKNQYGTKEEQLAHFCKQCDEFYDSL